MPASPSPASRIRVPSSTPAGMLTDRVLSLRVRPDPPQPRHGFSMTWPTPPQAGQVRSIVKKPCWARTFPAPWQVGQGIGFEPFSAPVPAHSSQDVEVGMRISVWRPRNASSRLIDML